MSTLTDDASMSMFNCQDVCLGLEFRVWGLVHVNVDRRCVDEHV
jgi:hypothetical protein